MPVVLRPRRTRRAAHACLAAAAALLAACGGSDSTTTPPPPPPTVQPVIGLNPTTLAFSTRAGATPSTSSTQVAIANTGTGTLSGLAIGTITYGAGASNWLTATLSGNTAPATITATADWAGLAPGTYTATIPVTSTVTGVTAASVTATLTVTAPPAIRLVPDNAGFAAVVGGASPASQTIVVENAGGGTLDGLSLGTIAYTGPVTGWLNAQISGPQAAASVALTASVASLQPGVYLATVPVRSTAAGVTNSPQNINVAFTVSFPPSRLELLPSSTLTFNAPQGGAVAGPQTLRIIQGNGSGNQLGGLSLSPVTYGAGASGWLVVERAPGTSTPDSLRVTVGDVTALAAGNYTASFDVRTTAAGVSSAPVTVNLSIGPAVPPRVQLSRDTVRMAMQQGGPQPPFELVQITNGGTAPLTGLSIRILTGGQWLAPTLTPSGNGAILSVLTNVNALTLARGLYTANIEVSSNAPNVQNSPTNVTVLLQVR